MRSDFHRRAVLGVTVLLLLAASLLVLDHMSRTRIPTSNFEAAVYVLWQQVWYGDQTDRFERPTE